VSQNDTNNRIEAIPLPLPTAKRTVLLDRNGFQRLLERAARDCGSKAELARRLGVTGQFICDLIAGKRRPGRKMLSAFGAVERKMIEIEVEDGQ
jgi:hypothetical protein